MWSSGKDKVLQVCEARFESCVSILASGVVVH